MGSPAHFQLAQSGACPDRAPLEQALTHLLRVCAILGALNLRMRSQVHQRISRICDNGISPAPSTRNSGCPLLAATLTPSTAARENVSID